MSSTKKYKTKTGITLYRVQFYTGENPATHKKTKSSKSGFKSEKEARNYGKNIEDGLISGHSHKSYTFFQVYQAWMKIHTNEVRESSLIRDEGIFRLHILPTLKDKKIDSITTIECQQLLENWIKGNYTKFRNYLGLVRRVFEYGQRMGLCSINPVLNVYIPKLPTTSVKKSRDSKNNFFELDQLRSFLKAVESEKKDYLISFFQILAFSGMRKGECLALTWQDINFSERTINVSKTIAEGKKGLTINPPKNGKSRVVSVNEETMKILEDWKTKQKDWLKVRNLEVKPDDDQLLFPNQKNKLMRPQGTTEWINSITNKFNLKHVTCHGLRHTFATLGNESGLSIKEIQVQLGHSSMRTTIDTYTSLTEKAKSAIGNKFGNYVDD